MKFVAGDTCLDFVNTVGGRIGDSVLRDKLGGFDDLLRFARLSGLLSPSAARRLQNLAALYPQAAAAALARAVRFRESIYRVLQSHLDRRPPHARDLAILTHEVKTARCQERLVPSPSGFAFARNQDAPALSEPLWHLARSAANLLTSLELTLLRQCAGEKCGWLFLDTSRNHARRWCDMKDCGNRAKVRRFRRRQARQGE